MLEIIFSIIFLIGFLGMLFIVLKNLSKLTKLPEKAYAPVSVKEIVSDLRESNANSRFSIESILEKLLSKVRVLILKSDDKTSNWLHSLKQKSQKNTFENDTYWKDLRKRMRRKK